MDSNNEHEEGETRCDGGGDGEVLAVEARSACAS